MTIRLASGIHVDRLVRLAALTCLSAAIWIPVHGYFGILGHFISPLSHWFDTVVVVIAKTFRWTLVAPVAIVVAERVRFTRQHRARDIAFAGTLLTLLTLAGPLLTDSSQQMWPIDPTALTLATLAVLFGYILVAREEAAVLRRRRREMEAMLAQTRAELFRARIAPRFLFSALNEIGRNVQSNPRRAEKALLDFSEFLRAFGDIAPRPAITIERELDVLERFAAVGMRVPFTVDVDDEALQAKVAPLSIFHLVATLATEALQSIRVEVRDGSEIVAGISLVLAASGEPGLQEREAVARFRHLVQRDPSHTRLEVHARDGRLVIGARLRRISAGGTGT